MPIDAKMPYRRTLYFNKPTAGADDLVDERVPAGYIVQLTHIAFVNWTSAMDSVFIGCRAFKIDHWWEEQLAPIEDRLYWTTEEYWLAEMEQLVLRMDGGAEDDAVWIFIEGFLWQNPPGGG